MISKESLIFFCFGDLQRKFSENFLIHRRYLKPILAKKLYLKKNFALVWPLFGFRDLRRRNVGEISASPGAALDNGLN